MNCSYGQVFTYASLPHPIASGDAIDGARMVPDRPFQNPAQIVEAELAENRHRGWSIPTVLESVDCRTHRCDDRDINAGGGE